MKVNKSVFPGAVFNKLTVIERLPKDGKGYYRVRCRCECGNITTPVIASIVNQTSRSCGCTMLALPGEGYGKIFPGAVLGRLTVIERKGHKVECRCKCGIVKEVGIDAMVSGNARSCGCLQREVTTRRNKESAKWKSFSARFPMTYQTWIGMVQRCEDTTCEKYGGRGVKVCEFLKASPWNFKRLLGKRPTKPHTIDRFPIHDGNYCCGECEECKAKGWNLNVRWATRKEQALNKGSFNVMITAFGRTQTKSQWCEETGLSWSCLTHRLRRGWDTERALSTPSLK